MNKKLNDIILRFPIYTYTTIFLIIPIFYMFILSFLSKAKTWGISFDFTLNNYQKVFEGFYLNIIFQSIQIAFVATIIVALIGYPYGYYMAKLNDKWKRRVMLLIMLPFWTSGLIRLNGWIIIFRSNGVLDKILMSLNIIEKPLKLLYSYPAVLTGMVYFLLPMMILSVFSSVEKMDWKLVEAARDLGASKWQAFKDITFKLTLPGLLSGVVLTFVPCMGLFYIAEILGGNKIILIGSLIAEQITKGRNTPLAAAFSVILMVITSIILRLYRKLSHTSELEGLF